MAKSWAGPDSRSEGAKYRPSSASKAGRDYPRPWLSGSKPAGKNVGDKDNMRPQAKTGDQIAPDKLSDRALRSVFGSYMY